MQENMFKLGSKNPGVVDDFLGYSRYPNELPMCLGLNTLEAIGLLKKQTPFKECVTYPVEYAVLQHKKKSNTFEDRDDHYTELYKKHARPNSSKHLCGKLRIWWAYNLAIAASQGKM